MSPGPFRGAPETHTGPPSLPATGINGPQASLLACGTIFLDKRLAALQPLRCRDPGEEWGERQQHLWDSPRHRGDTGWLGGTVRRAFVKGG